MSSSPAASGVAGLQHNIDAAKQSAVTVRMLSRVFVCLFVARSHYAVAEVPAQ
jgi:hypothetical protein